MAAIVYHKMFVNQIHKANQHVDKKNFTFKKIHFYHAWVQGMVVATSESGMLLDDATGMLWVDCSWLENNSNPETIELVKRCTLGETSLFFVSSFSFAVSMN
jgi:hypothetical protein